MLSISYVTWPTNWQLAGSILNSTQLASLWLRCLYWVHSTRPKSQQTLTAQPKKAGSLRNTQLVFFGHKKYRLFYFILFYVKIKPRFEGACRSLQCSFILFPFLHNLFDFFTFQQFPELCFFTSSLRFPVHTSLANLEHFFYPDFTFYFS